MNYVTDGITILLIYLNIITRSLTLEPFLFQTSIVVIISLNHFRWRIVHLYKRSLNIYNRLSLYIFSGIGRGRSAKKCCHCRNIYASSTQYFKARTLKHRWWCSWQRTDDRRWTSQRSCDKNSNFFSRYARNFWGY